LATTRLKARAWLPGFFGVLHYAGDAELAAATLVIVVRTINPTPGVAAADFDAPALPFGLSKGFLDFFLRMRGTGHQ